MIFYNVWFYFFLDIVIRFFYQNDFLFGIYIVFIRVVDRFGQLYIILLIVILCDCIIENDCIFRVSLRIGNGEVKFGIWVIFAILLGIVLLFCKFFYEFK